MYSLCLLSYPGFPWRNPPLTIPNMKSASESPVPWPLKVNAPLVGRLLSVSMRERIQLPPIDSWCAPRTMSRSSATCHPLELKYPGFVAPDPTEKPLPVTLTPTYPGTRLETREPRSVALKYAGSGRSFSVRLNVTCNELRID